MSDMTLEELSARTIVAANTLTLKPGQENYVAPVSHSIAEAYVNPTTARAPRRPKTAATSP